MRTRFRITPAGARARLLSFALSVILLSACSSEQPVEPVGALPENFQADFAGMNELEQLLVAHGEGASSLEKRGRIVNLPAGSQDGLAAAIAAAGKRGTVRVEAGLHTESQTVTITHAVRIIGESGAIFEFATQPWPPASEIDAALHIKNADDVVIWNLEIQPASSIGGTAILVEDSKDAIIGRNTMRGHQFSVLVEGSDEAKIYKNTIIATTAWQTGALSAVHGVVVINGKKAEVENNDISNALFGLWACDENGEAERNTFHGNFVGLILCKVPANFFPLPGGKLAGSALPATSWQAKANNATGNFNAGYLVIDGANNNRLKDNNASNNGTYDFDLTGDTYRFGFLTPKSFDNKVVAGAFQNVRIKNCGENNTVLGGQLVDNTQDPCN